MGMPAREVNGESVAPLAQIAGGNSPADEAAQAAAPIEATPPPEPEPVPVGRRLAEARMAQRLSIEAVAAGTKIKMAHLESIEAGDVAALPATPYTAGFVKAYARFLGLDAEELSQAWRAEAAAAAPSPPPAASVALAARGPALPENLAAWLGAGAAALVVGWIVLKIVAPKSETPAPVVAAAPAEPRVTQGSWAESASAARTTLAEVQAAEAQPRASTGSAPIAPSAEQTRGAAPRVETPVAAAQPSAQPAAPSPIAAPAPVETASATGSVAAPAQEPGAEQAEDTPPSAEPLAAADADLPAPPAELVVAAIESPPDIPTPAPALSQAKPRAAETPAREKAVVRVEAPSELAPAVAAAEAEAVSRPASFAAPASPARPQIVPARMTRSFAPRYPERCAKSAAALENVEVVFDVSAAGRPVGAQVIQSSNPCFNAAAIAAANRMQFAPRTVDGQPAIEPGQAATIRFQK
jgi:TonB family protein